MKVVSLFDDMFNKKDTKMEKQSWRNIGIKDKMQIVNGTVLVFAAIVLYFIAFALTLEIGYNIITAGATLLATGLAFFGITSYIKNQVIDMQNEVNRKLERIEEYEKKRKRKDDEEK